MMEAAPWVSFIDALSRPGGKGANEDLFGVWGDTRQGTAWVLDGATGLGGRDLVPGAASDAAWYVAELDAALRALSPETLPVPALFHQCLNRVADRYAGLVAPPEAGGASALPRYVLPSAAGAWVRWDGDGHLDYAGLGDCRALWKPVGEATRTLGGEELVLSDSFINAAVRRLQAEGEADPAVRFQRLMAGLRHIRSHMNLPGGYWVLGIHPQAADHLVRESLLLGQGGTLILLSDGFYRLVDTYHAYSADGLVNAARARGLTALYQELCRIEAEDADCSRHPRLKPSDDATALILVFAPPAAAGGAG